MKKKKVILLTIIFTLLLSLSGCKNNSKNINEAEMNSSLDAIAKDYFNNRVKYLGNNSKVSNLLDVLGVGDLGAYTIELATSKEPYSLTINYTSFNETATQEKFEALNQIDYAYYLLALVDNLSIVDVNYETANYHLDVEEANSKVNGEIKDYGSSVEKIKDLAEILKSID